MRHNLATPFYGNIKQARFIVGKVKKRFMAVSLTHPVHPKLALLIFAVLISTYAIAQRPKFFVYGGPTIVKYNGELGSFDNSSGAVHLGLQFNKKDKLNGTLNLGFGSTSGQDVNFGPEIEVSTSPNPNNFFKSRFLHVTYELLYNFIRKENYNIYLSQGIGIFRFNPQDDEGNDLQDLNSTRNPDETYRNATLMLPTSVGGVYFLPNKFGFGAQVGLYNTLTNYLDNISELGDENADNLLGIRFMIYAPIK